MTDQYRQPSPYSTREHALAELRQIRRLLVVIGAKITEVLDEAAEVEPDPKAKSGGVI